MKEYSYIHKQDKAVYRALVGEEEREREGLELIPSENYVSRAVREANASIFTNKYSEGYPGRRYYGGQRFTDEVERIAIMRACELFGARYANVQPLSGASANLALYFALLKPGETILGMDLSHGGHLTHGHPATVAANLFRFVGYKMKNVETGEIDYQNLREVALRERPKIILAGFSAYSRELDYKKFVDIAREIDAYSVIDVSHIAGLIAGKALPNPFEFGFDVMTSTTHKTLRGPRGGLILVRDREDIAKAVDKAVFPGLQGGPHMHTIAAKAVCFGEASKVSFKKYAKQVLRNAKAMEEVFAKAKVRMIGGGTSNHLLLIDAERSFSLSGGEAEKILDSIGITLNKNVIADDSRKPLDPSGIRLGTPAITTRGFKEKECRELAEIILAALVRQGKEKDLHLRVKKLAKKFPIPSSF